MSKFNGARVCVTLPSPISYSETFLQAHVDRLAAAVNYLQDFPIDIDTAFPNQKHSNWTEQLVHHMRIWWHRYTVNPVKKIAVRSFLRKKNIDVVLAEYGLTAIGAATICRELNVPLVVHFHGMMLIRPTCLIDIVVLIKACSITPVRLSLYQNTCESN